MSELLLSSLYESLGAIVAKLEDYEAGTNLLLSRPYWLLQLWLNSTFEPSLRTAKNVDEEDPKIVGRSIEGIRLLQLTPSDDAEVLQAFLTKYMLMFSKRHNFTPTMAPFANRTHGPSWFTSSFEDVVKNADIYIENIWHAFLLPRPLVSSTMLILLNLVSLLIILLST